MARAKGSIGLLFLSRFCGGAGFVDCYRCDSYKAKPVTPQVRDFLLLERKMEMDYKDILSRKMVAHKPTGFEVVSDNLHSMLFDWQKEIVSWSLALGKSAMFEERGLGKTLQQLEWARQVASHSGGRVLIICPLAVANQTIKEAAKIDMKLTYVRSMAEATEPVSITNYDMIKHFDLGQFAGIVLDESSILKSYTGKIKRYLIDECKTVKYKLACTATPAPNDHLELGNHAEWLDIMPSNEMISRWFINDSMEAGGYRLKNYAAKDFYRWMTSWAVFISTPADLNYPDDDYNLPPLEVERHMVEVDQTRAFEQVEKNGQRRMFLDTAPSATGMWAEKKHTYRDRAQLAANIVNATPDEYHIVWCDTNKEADEMRKLLPQAVEVRGSDSVNEKERKIQLFSDGEVKVIITKGTITGMGMNWQHCRLNTFVSTNYKWEEWYQAIGRTHRYGQERPVKVNMIYSETEQNIIRTLERKGEQHDKMKFAISRELRKSGLQLLRRKEVNVDIGNLPLKAPDFLKGQVNRAMVINQEFGENWAYYQGDCVNTLRGLPDNSIDHHVYSPPFSTLYIYSDSVADMGNTANDKEFFDSYEFALAEMYRTVKPGRYQAVHCKDLPSYMNSNGYFGLKDFPGEIIRRAENQGWVFQRWVTVWKDPVIEMQRTKNHGLLWKNFTQRAEVTRQGMADFVLIFQKPEIEGDSYFDPDVSMPYLPDDVVARARQLWTNEREYCVYDKTHLNGNPVKFGFFNEPLASYTDDFIGHLEKQVSPSRSVVIRCMPLELRNEQGDMVGYHDMAGDVIERFEQFDFRFRSRIALTDGTSLIVFTNWINGATDKLVQNKPSAGWYIGKNPPQFWENDRDYSIQCWQKYASPVWFDLEGLPLDNKDCWFDINQTKVLNARIARDNEDEKHICPLQLDVIDKCILEYTEPGEIVSSSFGGIGSEGYQALRLQRKAILIELKGSYFLQGVKYLHEAELKNNQMSIEDVLAGSLQTA